MLHRYLPSVSPDHNQRRPGLTWLDERAGKAFYPHRLVSYPYWRDERVEAPKDAVVLGDSGGFQAVSKGMYVAPEQAILWQRRNCTIGLMLDRPPYRMGGQSVFGGTAGPLWERSLERSLANVHRALPYYEDVRDSGSSFRWWGVVHGDTYERMEEWYARIGEVYPFDGPGEGWAFKPHPANTPVAIARTMRFIQQHGIRRVHLLQQSAPAAVGTALALARLGSGPEVLYYDSAAPTINAVNRTVWSLTRDGLGRTASSRLHGRGTEAIRRFLQDCGCPSCVQMRDDDRPLDDLYYVHRLELHNFAVLLRVFERLGEEAAANPKLLMGRLIGSKIGTVLRVWRGDEREIVAGP